MKQILNGIKKENPIFILLLGLCPALAVTHRFESAYLMGISVIIILLFSNVTISIIRKLIPENVKIPVYIIIIATFVTTVEMLIKAYTPDLHATLGIYLPLITVNCIVLGRAIAVASKENVKKSFTDAIGIGLGFLFALALIGFVRELLAYNTITIMADLSRLTGYSMVYKITPFDFKVALFSSPAGAFLTLGFLLAFFNYMSKRGEQNELN